MMLVIDASKPSFSGGGGGRQAGIKGFGLSKQGFSKRRETPSVA